MQGSECRSRAFGPAQRWPPQERQSLRRCTAKLFWTSHPPPFRSSGVRLVGVSRPTSLTRHGAQRDQANHQDSHVLSRSLKPALLDRRVRGPKAYRASNDYFIESCLGEET